MRFIKYYREPYTEQLDEILKTLRIRHKVTPSKMPYKLITFYYPEDKKMDDNLSEMLGKGIGPLRFVEYSEEDRRKAKFLTILPKWNRVSLVYKADAFGAVASKLDGRHMCQTIQIKPLVIEKEPKWKEKTAFYAQENGYGLLFTDDRVRRLIDDYHLKGVEVLPLTLKTGRILESSFQLLSYNILDSSAIHFTEDDMISCCPECGTMKICERSDYRMFVDYQYLDIEQDFYMTEPIFGRGWSYSKHFISQKFYQLLSIHNLIGEVEFSPVFDANDMS